jgi:hypothetical protein
MTVALCDMQSEDAIAESVLWKNMIIVMEKHGIPEPKFKGFMANSAQANWNDVRIIYGSGDATIPIKDQERTCLQKRISVLTSKTNTAYFVGSIRMQLHLLNLRLVILPFEHGSSPPWPIQSRE